MRGGRRFLDLTSGAETLVGAPLRRQALDRSVVKCRALSLAHHIRIPRDADGPQITELPGFRAGPGSVKIFHAQQEITASGLREQPCQDGRAEVANVQLAGRAGGKSPCGSHAPSLCAIPAQPGNTAGQHKSPSATATIRWLRGSCCAVRISGRVQNDNAVNKSQSAAASLRETCTGLRVVFRVPGAGGLRR
ncbi:hypothetical protein PJL18_04188 [Paenarthrobacter nicotinovorans]|nr:hypothetical protein [Paenarthrobacter nicotinovorans]